jgi:aryl-alcohol dehydrogenase-like predicted oxidoreductase
MHYRKFGNTGLYVSELCLGTMTFGGSTGIWKQIGAMAQREVESMLSAAFNAGINLIDTADVYAEGESESLLGAAIRSMNVRRDAVVIATKVRGRTGPGPNQIGLSRAHITAGVEDSLRRLRTDFIDLYQIHGYDPDTPIEETVRALDDLVRIGKVRYVGFSNLAAWYAMKALAYADAHHLARFVSAQVYYSLAGRDIEREIVPLAQDQSLAILPWSPLAGGLLSGKFDPAAPATGPEGARRTTFDFPPVHLDRAKRILTVLRRVSAATGLSVPRIALAWLLTRPFVTSVIIGAKTQEQFADNIAASEVRLSAEDIAALDEASALPSEYPAWMLDRQGAGRRPA